jgi:hypothetical protein
MSLSAPEKMILGVLKIPSSPEILEFTANRTYPEPSGITRPEHMVA